MSAGRRAARRAEESIRRRRRRWGLFGVLAARRLAREWRAQAPPGGHRARHVRPGLERHLLGGLRNAGGGGGKGKSERARARALSQTAPCARSGLAEKRGKQGAAQALSFSPRPLSIESTRPPPRCDVIGPRGPAHACSALEMAGSAERHVAPWAGGGERGGLAPNPQRGEAKKRVWGGPFWLWKQLQL